MEKICHPKRSCLKEIALLLKPKSITEILRLLCAWHEYVETLVYQTLIHHVCGRHVDLGLAMMVMVYRTPTPVTA
ncbi:hypothetical protein HOLleu_12111 [Holothuria leucospilota]|uniref:Uncharacterized protein n=1 Tax=Holothuria leucospilota TaxID=206669 RepID=A0A9Q1C9P0_HOLLE|nr:hypothetical protein HOLleu_12111 [Holothuria leucospilota]